MAQAQIDLIGLTRKCKYCDKTFRSEAGELNHMKRMHPLDMESDARCWTCNKAFTKRKLLYQHYSTVLHQLNCKRYTEGEIPEKEEKLIESAHSGRSTLKQAKIYRKQLMERNVRFQPYKKKPLCSLRSTPAIIPLEPTCPQADPRTDPKVTFMDLVEDEETHTEPSQLIEVSNTTEESKLDEILEFLLSTEEDADKEVQSVKSTKIYPQKEREAQSAKSTEIYPEIYPEVATTTTTREESIKEMVYPVIYPEKQHSSKRKEPTNLQEASIERRTEIYPEIYPENSSGATRGSLQSKTEESTPKLQNIEKLSKFEKEIIEMFEIPENFKEITSSDTMKVDLDLQTSLNLPLEENSLLDLLIDSEIV